MSANSNSIESGVKTVIVRDMSNREFLERHAAPGCIGLAGGVHWVDRAIRRAERHLSEERAWGTWSHAFVFGEKRVDGHFWVIESDIQLKRKHLQLGVQENRIHKYHDEDLYGTLAILDFGLKEETLKSLLSAALDLVADKTRYSIRELFGALLALRRQELRPGNNKLAREESLYCSALVQILYQKIGIELSPGVHGKNSTPEDIALCALPHTRYILERPLKPSLLERVEKKIQRRRVARAERKAGEGADKAG